jgi:hypothetical protein
MKKNPDVTMSELKTLGGRQGIHVYPLIMGLARKELGLGSKRKGASKKATKKTRAAGARGPGRPRKAGTRGPGRPPKAGTRGPGRPRKAGTRGPGRPRKAGVRGPGRPPKAGGPSDPAAAISKVLSHMRDLEREVSSLRAAMAKIADISSKG